MSPLGHVGCCLFPWAQSQRVTIKHTYISSSMLYVSTSQSHFLLYALNCSSSEQLSNRQFFLPYFFVFFLFSQLCGLNKCNDVIELRAPKELYYISFTYVPPKFYRPFLCTAPLQYIPKILFTQATIDCVINNKTKNALHNEAVILNYISGEPMSHGLSN